MNTAQMMKQIEQQISGLSENEKNLFANFSATDQMQLYAMAYEFYRNGKYADSKSFFVFLTLLNALDRRFWIGRGACHQMLKEYQPAIECYSVAAVQNPDDPYVHQYAADCFFAMGDLPLAIKTLGSAMAAAKKIEELVLLEKLEMMHNAWKQLQIKGGK